MERMGDILARTAKNAKNTRNAGRTSRPGSARAHAQRQSTPPSPTNASATTELPTQATTRGAATQPPRQTGARRPTGPLAPAAAPTTADIAANITPRAAHPTRPLANSGAGSIAAQPGALPEDFMATMAPLAPIAAPITTPLARGSRLTPSLGASRQTPAIPSATPAAPDAAHLYAPPADALDSERILELPARRGSTARAPIAQMEDEPEHSVREPRQPYGLTPPDALPPAPASANRATPAPRRGSRGRASASTGYGSLNAGSSGMLSLGAAVQAYSAVMRGPSATRRSDPGDIEAGNGDRSSGGASGSRPPSPPDSCPYCFGAGYVRLDVPFGDPAFGQAVACVCKERELEERRLSDLRRMSSLDAFRDKTFDNFDLSAPGVREAYEAARHYAEDPHGWLVLGGGYGAGKTHLAAAIAHERLAAGQSVFFSIVPDLLDHLRAAFAPTSETTYDELFDKVREAGVLILDDLGAENTTAWATEKLFQIINYRYNYHMPTVVTTNNRLLSHIDERIRSRLADLSFVRHVNVEAPDYRERHSGRGRGTTLPPASGPRSRGGPRGGYQR